jgi:hypothetical protein
MTPAEMDAALTLAEEASKRADAATPGPWLHFAVTGQSRGSTFLGIYTADAQQVIVSDCDGLDTAEFLCAARQDVPALAHLIRRLVDEVLTLRAVLADATAESAMYERGVRDALAAVEAADDSYSADGGSTRRGIVRALAAVRALLPP